MKTKTELSTLQCVKALPKSRPYKISDRGGLHLLVLPNGTKLWRWKYRFEGKEKQMALGRFPDVSLAQARLQHAAARADLANNVDPMAERKKERDAALAVAPAAPKKEELTFEELAMQWFSWWKADKHPRYVAMVESRLKADVLDKIGHLKPEDVKRTDVVRLTMETGARARDIARRNLQFVRQIYIHGMNIGLLDENAANPAADIEPRQILAKTKPTHFASLPVDQLPELFQKMQDYSGHIYTRLAMELIGLTVLRTSELIGGLWTEIDWKAKRWNVGAERMKMNTRHIVPLSDQAVEVLKHLHRVSGSSGRLFPDYNGGPGTMSNNTILAAFDRMGYRGRMTGHGWRAIFSTHLREQGFERHLVETQLAHLSGNEVERAYNYALYLEPRAKMMQHWADFLDQCRAGKASGTRAA
ncbi:MAG TPA: tyrosine-type recombinase/integrase [Terracidiphilus sp.]